MSTSAVTGARYRQNDTAGCNDVKRSLSRQIRPERISKGKYWVAMSADGVVLDCRHFPGGKEYILNLSYRVNLRKIDVYLSIKGTVRAVLSVAVFNLSRPED